MWEFIVGLTIATTYVWKKYYIGKPKILDKIWVSTDHMDETSRIYIAEIDLETYGEYNFYLLATNPTFVAAVHPPFNYIGISDWTIRLYNDE